MYDLNFTENLTEFLPLVQGVNTNLAAGHYGTMVLATFCIVAIMSMIKYDLKKSMIGISFGLSVFGGLLWAAELLQFYVLGIVVIVMFAVTLINFVVGGND